MLKIRQEYQRIWAVEQTELNNFVCDLINSLQATNPPNSRMHPFLRIGKGLLSCLASTRWDSWVSASFGWNK